LFLGIFFTTEWTYDGLKLMSYVFFGLFLLGVLAPIVGFVLVLRFGSSANIKVAHFELQIKTNTTSNQDNTMVEQKDTRKKKGVLPDLRVEEVNGKEEVVLQPFSYRE
jgi:hypothetical protein